MIKKAQAELIRGALYRTEHGPKYPPGDYAPKASKTLKSGKKVRRCAAKIFRMFEFHQCHSGASIKRGKHWFCKQCDPIARDAKREARAAEWQKVSDEADRQWRREERVKEAERKLIQAAKDWCSEKGLASDVASAVLRLNEAEKES